MLLLEPGDNLLERRVVVEFDSVPEGIFNIFVLKSRQQQGSNLDVNLTFSVGAAIGSEKPKKGKARLTNPFL